jgi:hypothetical protein
MSILLPDLYSMQISRDSLDGMVFESSSMVPPVNTVRQELSISVFTGIASSQIAKGPIRKLIAS